MIKIFATPKSLEGIINKIQNNALNSWRALSSSIELFIIRNSKGNKEVAAEINAKYVTEFRCFPCGVLYLLELFFKSCKFIFFVLFPLGYEPLSNEAIEEYIYDN